MELFRCYCFDSDGKYDVPKDFDNPQDALTYVSRKINLFPRVLVTDALDLTVYEAVDGKTVFPIQEQELSGNRIKVLIVEPRKEPYISEIENALKAMQAIVGGCIEMLGLAEGETLVCNEEGKLLQLEGNRRVGNDIIAGSFFIAGDNEDGELISLTDEQIRRYAAIFKEPEFYSSEQVEDAICVKVIGFEPSMPLPPTFDEMGNKFIDRINNEILPKVNYEALQKSYATEEKQYAKEVLKSLHDAFVEVYDTDTIYDGEDDFVLLPAVIKGNNTNEICIGLVDIDLGSSGEQFDAIFLTKFGAVNQGDANVSEEVSNFISKSYMPYDYYYTIGVEHDIHINLDEWFYDVRVIGLLFYPK